MRVSVDVTISSIDLRNGTASFLLKDEKLPSSFLDRGVQPREVACAIIEECLQLHSSWLDIELVDVVIENDVIKIFFCTLVPKEVEVKNGCWVPLCTIFEGSKLDKTTTEIILKSASIL